MTRVVCMNESYNLFLFGTHRRTTTHVRIGIHCSLYKSTKCTSQFANLILLNLTTQPFRGRPRFGVLPEEFDFS